MRRAVLMFLGVIGGLVVVVAVALGVLIISKSEDLPTGQTGAPAEALTRSIEKATALDAFTKLAAVRFTFRNGTRHFRDFGRGLIEVRWQKGGDEIAVQYNKMAQYVALRNENPVTDPAEARKLFEHAYKRHINDFFWLNPFSTLRAPGTERKLVGERALLVSFKSGGVTPGDSYLFVTDRNGRPEAIKMWVKIIPIKGMRFSFDGWQDFPGGVKLSLKHSSSMFDVNLRDVGTLAQYPEPGKPDRFAPLLTAIAKLATK